MFCQCAEFIGLFEDFIARFGLKIVGILFHIWFAETNSRGLTAAACGYLNSTRTFLLYFICFTVSQRNVSLLLHLEEQI